MAKNIPKNKNTPVASLIVARGKQSRPVKYASLRRHMANHVA